EFGTLLGKVCRCGAERFPSTAFRGRPRDTDENQRPARFAYRGDEDVTGAFSYHPYTYEELANAQAHRPRRPVMPRAPAKANRRRGPLQRLVRRPKPRPPPAGRRHRCRSWTDRCSIRLPSDRKSPSWDQPTCNCCSRTTGGSPHVPCEGGGKARDESSWQRGPAGSPRRRLRRARGTARPRSEGRRGGEEV